ncbi:MAG: sigma factor-like helix-turn-helix DNA-binding protein [Acidimicrobiales bacterium]
MTSYLWPSDEGWPYPDGEGEEVAFDELYDDDALTLRAAPPHLFESLAPLERRVVTAHYGLDGSEPRSMKELHRDLGLTRAEVREALASGLAKLRSRLLVE